MADVDTLTASQARLHLRRQTWSGFAAAAVVVVFWSGFNIVSRLGGRSALTPFDLAAMRFGISALLLLPVFLRRPRAIAWPRLLVLGGFGGLGYGLLVYTGFSLAPASHAGILVNGGIPFATALFAWPLLGFRPKRGVAVAFALTGLGIALIGYQSLASETGAAPRQWLGDLFFFGGALCWGVFGVLLRKWNLRPFDAMAGIATVSALVFLPIYLLALPKALTLVPIEQLLLQGVYQGVIAAVLAGLLYAHASQTIGPIKAALMLALVPGISAVAAVPILNEPLGALTVAGLLCVSGGAILGAIASTPPGVRRR
jgi:drug/metabolite transporter (DMT)-like permease